MLTESTANAPPEEIRKRLDHAVEFVERNFQGEQDVRHRCSLDWARIISTRERPNSRRRPQRKADAIVERLNNDPYMQTEVGCRRARDLALAHHLPEARARLAAARERMRHLHVVVPGLRVHLRNWRGADCAGRRRLCQRRSRSAFGIEQSRPRGQPTAPIPGWSRRMIWLARLYMAGDFRGAWEADGANLKVAKEHALTESSRYFAIASVGCNALRTGGQPRNRAISSIPFWPTCGTRCRTPSCRSFSSDAVRWRSWRWSRRMHRSRLLRTPAARHIAHGMVSIESVV